RLVLIVRGGRAALSLLISRRLCGWNYEINSAQESSAGSRDKFEARAGEIPIIIDVAGLLHQFVANRLMTLAAGGKFFSAKSDDEMRIAMSIVQNAINPGNQRGRAGPEKHG